MIKNDWQSVWGTQALKRSAFCYKKISDSQNDPESHWYHQFISSVLVKSLICNVI